MTRARRLGLGALLAGVLAVHLGLADLVLDQARLGFGAAQRPPARIDVAFVSELAPSEPPAAPAAPAPRRPRQAAGGVTLPAEPAASAAQVAESVESTASVTSAASASEPAQEMQAEAGPAAASEPAAVAGARPEPGEAALASASGGAASSLAASQGPSAIAPPSAAAASAPHLEWPPSTRLSYRLEGNYRGPVEGQARVEWLLSGTRYQVHLDVEIGPPFAPLIRRRMSSDGQIGEGGLQPRRYDEETAVVFRSPRLQTVEFTPERIRLAGGREALPVKGVQDTASQFVQLTWMLTLQPSLLQVGRRIELPLALPRRVGTWTYEVAGEEALDLAVGRVPTWKLEPRPESARPGELKVQVWFAPTLQYLPVRIRIAQDADTWADLFLQRLPQQAAAPPR